VAWVLKTYQQPALAERFIDGPEITIGLLGNCGAARLGGQSAPWAELPFVDGVHVLPPYELLAEQFPASAGTVYTGQIKSGWQGRWVEGQHYRCPAALSPAQRQEVLRLAVATFRATGCRDVARVDLRLDANDGHRPYILEINALPGLAPDWSDMVFEAAAAGLSYDELILAIVHHGAQRLGLLSGPRPGAAESAAGNR
jgi:D-alanine-D-alanine ligase